MASGCADGDAGGSGGSSSGSTTAAGSETSSASLDTTASTTVGSSSSSGADSSSSGVDTSASAESSSTGTPAGCGDGNLDDGELCDDGDDEDGNGCNNDCTPSATALWELVHDIATNEGANRVAINDAGAVALVGTIFNETYDALTIGVDVEGTVEWAAMYDGPGTEPSNFDRGNGAAIDAAGNIYASGRSVELDEENHVWIRRYDVGGAIAWTLTGDDTTLGVATASVFGADGLDIVGTRPASAFVTRYDEAGAVQWDQDVVGDILCNDNCGFTQVDATDDGGVVAAGIVAGPGGGEVYVARFDTAGEPVWVQSIASATDATIRGIDGFESSVRVLVSGDTDHEVRSYDDAGDLEWTLDAPASVLATHVAGASDGDLFLAAADGDAVVVERIAIDGTAIWSVNHPAPDSATAPVLSGIAFGAGRVVLAGAVTVAGQSDVWAVAISQ